MRLPLRYLLLPFLAASVHLPAAAQYVIYVDDGATGANNGTSWSDAYTDLRTALVHADPIFQVWVAAGTYKPTTTGDRNESFGLPNRVTVYGGFDGTETSLDERAGLFDATILSGDLAGDDGPGFANVSDNSFHVAVGIGSLDGFTVVGGNADGSHGTEPNGGGLLIGAWGPVHPTIANCTFRANRARHFGGAVCLYPADATVFSNCVFADNRAGDEGGAVWTSGMDEGARFERCRFVGNVSGGGGGAVRSQTWEAFLSCEFVGNRADGAASFGGGALYGGSLRILQCTFSANSAVGSDRGGGAVLTGGDSFLRGSILWGNADGSGLDDREQIHVWSGARYMSADHCDIQGWTGQSFPGRAMLHGDPAFVDADGADDVAGTADDDLRLAPGSPCVDTGGVRSSMEPLRPLDLDGRPRFVDSLACDGSGVLDMGARERQAIDGTTNTCPQPPTSLGFPAEISAPCVVRAGDGPVTITVAPVHSSTGFLWFGSQSASVPFGVDTRCVGGELHRIADLTRIGDTLTIDLDLADPIAAALVPGSSWHFQAIFRDAGALRLSDATTITFRD